MEDLDDPTGGHWSLSSVPFERVTKQIRSITIRFIDKDEIFDYNSMNMAEVETGGLKDKAFEQQVYQLMTEAIILLSQSGIFQAELFRQYFLEGKADKPVEVRLGEAVYSFQHKLSSPERLGTRIGPVTIRGQMDLTSYDWLSAGRHKLEISRDTYKNGKLVKSQNVILDRAAEQGRPAVGEISYREHFVEEASGRVKNWVSYRNDTRAVSEVKKLLEDFGQDQQAAKPTAMNLNPLRTG